MLMSLIYQPHPFDETSKQHAVEALLDNITPDRDYYMLLICAALLAIGAIFMDSIPGLIASMIVAPLAMPILGLGLGIASGSWRLVRNAFAVLAMSFVIAFGLGLVITKIFGSIRVDNTFISFSPNRY